MLRHWLLDVWYALTPARLGLLAVPVVVLTMMVGVVQVARSGHADLAAQRERDAAVRCLALNIYHEARGEPLAGQYAVAEVTLNRVRSTRFPDTVCDVVYERRLDPSRRRYVGAFSWTGQNPRPPYGRPWATARSVAVEVLDGAHHPVVGDALFYHASRVSPAWSVRKVPLASIGDHVFYR